MNCPECEKTTRLFGKAKEMLLLIEPSLPPKLLGYYCQKCGCEVSIEPRDLKSALKQMSITPCD